MAKGLPFIQKWQLSNCSRILFKRAPGGFQGLSVRRKVEEVEEGEEVEFFIFLAAQGFNHFYLSGSPCTCNGVTVPTGWWKGLGSCGSLGLRVDCGDFCFVKGDCADQFLLYGLKEYGYASCTPCPQSRNAPPLKTAECPNNGSPSFIGIWLLAAAGRQCVGDPQFFLR